MAIINACQIPEDLYYDIPMHVWVRLEEDGTAVLGMTDPAQTRSGRLLRISIKKVGKQLVRGKTAAVPESSKWLGPFPTPLSGEVVEINDKVVRNPNLINRDLYGEGWIVRLRPTNLEEELPLLVTGDEAVDRYRRFIEEENILCIRCAD